MPDGGDGYSARTVSSIEEIGAEAWSACAAAASDAYNPFVSFEFLSALERSNSASAETGWGPSHVVLERGGDIVGVAPLYVKGHSQGEYIFDHHWADAYERAGGRYYPKLLCAAPFTPAQGPRLLTATQDGRAALAAALAQIAEQYGVSSLHVNFVLDRDIAALAALGYLERQGVQYHWFNRGYASFDAFLNALSSRKRKTINRERRAAAESGLAIRALRGGDIEDRHWEAFWAFYQDTGARKWGAPYLTRAFFDEISETMRERLLMIVAERNDHPIAGALNFIGGDTLYGRYWGCTEHQPFLHFEVCYHQAIEFAIDQKLACVEAGAQGEHKLARGYEPIATRSAHFIRDPGFRDAIARYLDSERAHGQAEIEVLNRYTPFKKG